MGTEIWFRDDCRKCNKTVGWGNLTQGGQCEECEYGTSKLKDAHQ